MQYREHMVPRGRYRIYARDYPGEEPEIVLMHGFPDDLHLYDRLVPHLSSRWVVVFDFLGWGRSDKPEGCPYTADNQRRDLDAVIWHPGLEVACWWLTMPRDRPRSTGRWRTRTGLPRSCC
jgi:haloalkane dehalogenase